jgi:predicted DNA-binding ribbon-helix-helix protein
MRSGARKIAPKLETEEEVAKFWLTHDTTDYVDWSKAEQPNLHRAGHVIPLTLPDDEYERLDRLAREEKKTIGELVRQIVHSGLNNIAAHRIQ